MAGFPWSELGLDGPADERGIRRAYAARLKIVRPDVDPDGFQRLVQARDVALRAIEQHAALPPPRSLPPNPPLTREPPAIPPQPPPPPLIDVRPDRPTAPELVLDLRGPSSRAETDQRNSRPPGNRPATIEIELSSEQSSSDTEQRPAPSSEPSPVTTDSDAPRPPPPSTDGAGQREDSLPARGSKVAGPEMVSALLSAFVDAWISTSVLPPAAPILSLLGEQSIAARAKLEGDILRAVAKLFANGLFDQTTPEARLQAARSLILGVDDDYGWTSSDRRLYQMMPQAAADQLLRQLRALREWAKTGRIQTGQMQTARTPDVTAAPRAKPRQRGASVALGLCAMILVSFVRVISLFGGNPAPLPTAIPNMAVPDFSSRAAPADYALSSFNQGAAYDRSARYDLAIQQYDQAIKLNPNYALAFYNRGLDYANKRQFDRAIQDYDSAIGVMPGNPDYFIARGVSHDAQGQYDRAIQDYDQAIRLDPANGLAYLNRGIAYANKDQADRAIQDYDHALRLNPNDADALYNRGQAKRARGDKAGADLDTSKARQINPDLPADQPRD